MPLGSADTLRECGAKALNLARLQRWGYSVPAGMVVVDGAFQRHLRDAGLEESSRVFLSDLATLEQDAIRQKSAAIRAAILDTRLDRELPERLAHAYESLWRGRLLAVRSSVAGEDG